MSPKSRLPAQGSGLRAPAASRDRTEAGEPGGVGGQAQAQARLGGKMAGGGSELSSRSVFLPLPPTFRSGLAAASVLSFGLCTKPLLYAWCRGTVTCSVMKGRNV